MEDKLTFENKNNFEIVLIKLNSDFDKLDWNDLNYTDNIINLDCYEVLNANSDNFVDLLSTNLLLDKYSDQKDLEITTQLIYEGLNYIYEIIYAKNLKEEKNGLGTLLNTNGDDIFGNVILTKTFIPTLSKSMVFENCYIRNIKDILESRINTNVVMYDIESGWTNKIIKGDLTLFADEFFDEGYVKYELPFLLHNLNIWYEKLDLKTTKNICGKILEKPIYKCIFFTMITDEHRGSLYLEEVEKIIKLSNVLDIPFTAKNEWIKEEDDEYKRPVIKNKYRVLDLAYNELICNNI